jgi:hypothetical protein
VNGSDRAEFELHLKMLCSGFNVPLDSSRMEAYWLGLSRMSLAMFARVVERCLGEDGPERIPTARQCWSISKKFQRAHAPTYAASALAPEMLAEGWPIDANLHLLDHIRSSGSRYTPDSRYNPTTRCVDVGPKSIAMVGLLVKAKNQWARSVMDGNTDPETQRGAWQYFMDLAHESMRTING